LLELKRENRRTIQNVNSHARVRSGDVQAEGVGEAKPRDLLIARSM